MEEYTHPTLDKIAELKDLLGDNAAYSSDLEQVDAWKKEIADLVSRETLAENDALQNILKEYEKEIENIDDALRTKDSQSLPSDQRDRLIDKKILYESFIKRFNLTDIRSQIETVDKAVSENITSLR